MFSDVLCSLCPSSSKSSKKSGEFNFKYSLCINDLFIILTVIVDKDNIYIKARQDYRFRYLFAYFGRPQSRFQELLGQLWSFLPILLLIGLIKFCTRFSNGFMFTDIFFFIFFNNWSFRECHFHLAGLERCLLSVSLHEMIAYLLVLMGDRDDNDSYVDDDDFDQRDAP